VAVLDVGRGQDPFAVPVDLDPQREAVGLQRGDGAAVAVEDPDVALAVF